MMAHSCRDKPTAGGHEVHQGWIGTRPVNDRDAAKPAARKRINRQVTMKAGREMHSVFLGSVCVSVCVWER